LSTTNIEKRKSPVRPTYGPVHLGTIHLAFRSLTAWVRVKQALVKFTVYLKLS
jgi:hypothetical protein